MKPIKLLSICLYLMAVFHLIVGAGLTLSPAFQQFAVHVYGCHFDWTVKDVYLVRVLGAFAFTFGVMAIAAARDPIRNRAIILGFIVLFIVRDVSRHVYFSELSQGFGLDATTNLITTFFFAIQGGVIAVLAWITRKEKTGS